MKLPNALITQALRDYRRVEKAIAYLHSHAPEHPELEEVASAIGLSPFHFQKLFKRWAGISPKQFLAIIALQEAKKLLQESRPLLDTSLDVGFSGPSRLHDLFLKLEAMTPGEYKNGGEGLHIHHGFHPTPFGEALVAATDRGICSLGFVESRKAELAALLAQWPAARFERDLARTGLLLKRAFEGKSETLHLKGTAFQLKVWQALLAIPPGAVTTYEAIAQYIGQPKAHRAVASAIAKNPIGYLIPCHRVIRKMGWIGGYRWGEARKQALLAREHRHPPCQK